MHDAGSRGEAARQIGNLYRETFPTLRGRKLMSTKLYKIAVKARAESKTKFTSLIHLLTPEFLIQTWEMMNRRGASGIDGETIKEFEGDLKNRVDALHLRIKSGGYTAPPVRRVEIPKPGSNKTRPLGIPTVEDRLLQKAVARILESIFEQDFQNCSYGFRPNKSPHSALFELRRQIVGGKVMQVYEADIRGYFNNINHEWLMRMLSQRVADPKILRLIGKWLRAGAIKNGVLMRSESGTPQGGPISCILSNIYLHFVLDLWFEKKIKPQCRGEVKLVRFVDDFVVCFQYKQDIDWFENQVVERMRKFSLELVPEKTQKLSFGRFAKEREFAFGRKTGKFVFLGFEHICGKDKLGKFALVRLPSKKSCRKFLDNTKHWLKKHWHRDKRDQQKHLTTMLRGFYQYFSLNHCREKLEMIFREVQRQWIRALRRRSQWHNLYWSYLSTREWFKLPSPPRVAIHQLI